MESLWKEVASGADLVEICTIFALALILYLIFLCCDELLIFERVFCYCLLMACASLAICWCALCFRLQTWSVNKCCHILERTSHNFAFISRIFINVHVQHAYTNVMCVPIGHALMYSSEWESWQLARKRSLVNKRTCVMEAILQTGLDGGWKLKYVNAGEKLVASWSSIFHHGKICFNK